MGSFIPGGENSGYRMVSDANSPLVPSTYAVAFALAVSLVVFASTRPFFPAAGSANARVEKHNGRRISADAATEDKSVGKAGEPYLQTSLHEGIHYCSTVAHGTAQVENGEHREAEKTTRERMYEDKTPATHREGDGFAIDDANTGTATMEALNADVAATVQEKDLYAYAADLPGSASPPKLHSQSPKQWTLGY
ncbi:hypothetical protein ACN47E_007566 [Coniothyrium glycines]